MAARLKLVSRRTMPVGAVALARYLIGKTLVRRLDGETLSGRIVETEAYLADDPASHSFSGPTRRNRSMFLRQGHAYVYRIYGMWQCFNVTSGTGSAVLVRAIEPVSGISTMERLRGISDVRMLARGPGRLCQALAIGSELDGLDVCRRGPVYLEDGAYAIGPIAITRRIGITKAADAPLRFIEAGNPFVSGSSAQNMPIA